ncbi:exosortase F system-associated protein [Rasiella rasia]|uniref:Exosortase F system-associated protein n=1 Tax=Rasiella rasia TaxID=2744027 RepID=A0A6G6GLF3_9FLAO|nr:exosortase F system-associated protein [Rasiella rasia]QIE59378.1 exosortase F system-associated protein [Rasiella rasia]
MSRLTKLFWVCLGFGLLVLIRVFEADLFYDPLLLFFKTDHTTAPLPDLNIASVMAHTLIRFLLNTAISLGILWVLFQKWEVVKFSAILYAIAGVVLGVVFLLLLHNSEAGAHITLFYVRRFLIQPLFLFLLAPAFYVQHRQLN